MSNNSQLSIAECNALITAPGAMLELEHAYIDGHVQRVYKNLPQNLRDFWLNSANVFGSREYVVLGNERITYAEMHTRVCRAASVFRNVYGVRKGDRIGIAVRNIPEWVVSYWAAQLLGAVAVAINALLPGKVLSHCLVHTQCKVIIIDAQRADRLENHIFNIRQEAGSTGVLVVRAHEGKGSWKGMKAWEEVMSSFDTRDDTAWQKEPACTPEDNATIFFTSGTTGLPKGVLSSHRGPLTNLLNVVASRFRAELRAGNEIPKPDPTPKGVLLSVPLFHTTGCTATLLFSTAIGGKVVMVGKWDPREAIQLIRQENLNGAGGVPSMVLDMLDSYSGEPIASMEGFSYGGASAPATMTRDLAKVFPAVVLSQGYGMTECNSVAVGIAGQDYLDRPTSTGLPTPVNDILIMDTTTMKAAPTGESGEVWIRGPNVMKGYWRDPAATAKTITRDGWLRSGDLGYVDSDGFLYIRDRLKDMIIRGGENVDSISVENAIHADPRILECAAVAVPDRRLGELVTAVVVPKHDYRGKIKEAEVIEITKQHLPAFAVPIMIIVLDEPMERNPAGKIMKGPLRKRAHKEWEKRKNHGKAKAPKSKL